MSQKSILEAAMERSRFVVENVSWRKVIDWSVAHVPAVFHRPLIWLAAFVFFFVATPARKALLRNLRVIRPRSWRLVNYLRVVRVFGNFGWSLTDTAAYRISKARFRYELEGTLFLEQLASAKNGIVVTAHMGNYDLAAALFSQKFHRVIRMVRASESDPRSAEHVDLALQQSSGGGVKVGYSDDGTALVFDLLNALRAGEIISMQGDRVVGEVSRAPAKFFGREVLLPNGPFVLSVVSQTPIYPLFIVRIGYRKYKIMAREPMTALRGDGSRDQVITDADAALDVYIGRHSPEALAAVVRVCAAGLNRTYELEIPLDEFFAEKHPDQGAEREIRAEW